MSILDCYKYADCNKNFLIYYIAIFIAKSLLRGLLMTLQQKIGEKVKTGFVCCARKAVLYIYAVMYVFSVRLGIWCRNGGSQRSYNKIIWSSARNQSCQESIFLAPETRAGGEFIPGFFFFFKKH
jgi:hypothetical protein